MTEKLKETKQKSLKNWLAHAFAVDSQDGEYSESDIALIERITKWVVERGMSVPAVLFLESFKPLGFLGNQFLVMAEPMVDLSFSAFPGFLRKTLTIEDYKRFTEILEHRGAPEMIIQKLTALENNQKKEHKKDEK